MPTILPFDDLETGRFVTIHSPRAVGRSVRRRRPPFEEGEPEAEFHIHLNDGGTMPPPGVPLHILALNAPFLMVMALHPGGRAEGPIYLDSRRVRLMGVPDEMIEVLRALGGEATPARVEDDEELEDLPF